MAKSTNVPRHSCFILTLLLTAALARDQSPERVLEERSHHGYVRQGEDLSPLSNFWRRLRWARRSGRRATAVSGCGSGGDDLGPGVPAADTGCPDLAAVLTSRGGRWRCWAPLRPAPLFVVRIPR